MTSLVANVINRTASIKKKINSTLIVSIEKIFIDILFIFLRLSLIAWGVATPSNDPLYSKINLSNKLKR